MPLAFFANCNILKSALSMSWFWRGPWNFGNDACCMISSHQHLWTEVIFFYSIVSLITYICNIIIYKWIMGDCDACYTRTNIFLLYCLHWNGSGRAGRTEEVWSLRRFCRVVNMIFPEQKGKRSDDWSLVDPSSNFLPTHPEAILMNGSSCVA